MNTKCTVMQLPFLELMAFHHYTVRISYWQTGNTLNVFINELNERDNILGEMPQILLKRLINKCTRLARSRLVTQSIDNDQVDIVRKFNILLDTPYKKRSFFGQPYFIRNIYNIKAVGL